MFKYDVIIVGGGCAGAFTALELIKLKSAKNVLIIEKGNRIEDRICPKRKGGNCVNCRPCNITTGFSGAGAYSDFKLTLTPEVGGNLDEYIGYDKTKELIDYVDNIYLEYGADRKMYGNEDTYEIKNIRKNAIKNNLKFVESPIRHIGTEEGYRIYTEIQNYLLDNGVDIMFKTMVDDLIIVDNIIKGIRVKNKDFYSDKVVLSVGREGSEWLKKVCEKNNINNKSSTIDIGIRLEVRNEIMKEINDNLYEGKFIYRTPTFDDKVRTFCQNAGGHVSIERYNDGIITVNGHSYKHSKTNNTNLALLVSKNMTEPFKNSIEYGKNIASLSNMLSGGSVLVQRYGDFKKGRRTTQDKLNRGNLIPTLKDAVAGDLSLVLPYRIMKDIEEMIEALNGVAEGINSDESLLYGVECKFYSNKLKVDNNFETNIKNLYAIGDGAGITRGIAQSNANGVYVARIINA